MISRELRGATVLVVDPNSTVRTMLHLLLSQHGYVVSQADSFAAALMAYTQETHTLVIAAEQLGNHTGLELIHILHTRQHAPGGIIVGRRSLQRAQTALRSGADEYVARPINEADLVLSCEHALAARAVRGAHALSAARIESLQNAFMTVLQTASLAAQSRLAGYIAHEINNPLTPIFGQAELLSEEFPPNDPRRTQLSSIILSVRRIRTVIHQMLEFSRPATQQRVIVDLADVLRNTLALTEQRLRAAGITLLLTLSERMMLINAHTQQLTDALLHLVDNAYDAMPNGGTLAVTVALEAASMVGLHTSAPAPRVVIEIQDTGNGIATQHQPYIFDLFYSTKIGDYANGVGLPLAQSVIVMHGGTLTFTTREGVGSTFRMTLPLHSDSI